MTALEHIQYQLKEICPGKGQVLTVGILETILEAAIEAEEEEHSDFEKHNEDG